MMASMTRRKKLAAVWVMTGGIAVLAGAGVALRRPALEQWCLWKLESGDPDEMHDAVRKLGELRSARAVPRLLDRIRMEEGGDKPPFGPQGLWAFVLSLAAIDAAAVPALIRGLEDEDDWVRQVSAHALGEIGPPAREAVPALLRLATDDSRYEEAVAARALGRIGDRAEEVVPVLVEMLEEHGGYFTRAQAAEALGRFGDRARPAIPALTKALEDNEALVHAAAAGALKNIRGE